MTFPGLADHRAIEFTSAELAQAMNSCFDGYVHPFTLEAPTFERRFRPEGLDSEASVLLYDGESPAAICLIARRGWTCRVAAMAIAPTFRGKGVGKAVMTTVIAEAKKRGDKRMVLEVIEQNPPAIGLYENVGMHRTRRLVGHLRKPGHGSLAQFEEIDPLALTRLMVTECDHELPWDYKPETLNAKGPPTKALSLDDKAFALVTDTPAERAVLWSLFTRREHRRQGYASRMVAGLASMFPTKTIVTPVALPDDLAPVFLAKTGFVEAEVSQLEMELLL